ATCSRRATSPSPRRTTATSGADGLWALNDEQLRIDYGYRAVHVVSIAAKAILAAYYGVGPQHSYFNGCSDGGREALMEDQRFPADFDGIVAGAPEIYAMPLNAEEQAWNAIANLGADGGPILTADKLPALHAAVLAACDFKEGWRTDRSTTRDRARSTPS